MNQPQLNFTERKIKYHIADFSYSLQLPAFRPALEELDRLVATAACTTERSGFEPNLHPKNSNKSPR
jgi:hypothetical protein